MPTPLLVPHIQTNDSATADDAGWILAKETEAHPVACLNWPAYPYKPDVRFRIAHVDTELWIRFDVAEERIRAMETAAHGNVYKDSCVELFISFDGTNYYNLEMNAIGTPHLGYGPGRQERRFVPLPLMKQLVTGSSLGATPFDEKTGHFEWTLTARIPIACFAFDDLRHLSGRSARANVYKCGDALAVPHYVTWLPVKTPAPDYHRPEFFGDVVFH